MLLISAFCVSGLDPSQRPSAAGMRRTVFVTCSSSRTISQAGAGNLAAQPAARVTFSSRSSSLTMPFRASRMNEFSCAGSFSTPGA